MAFFSPITAQSKLATKLLGKASGTVIQAWFPVTLSSGLAIPAVAASTAIAVPVADAPAGTTTVLVYADQNIIFEWEADATPAVTNRNTEVDLVVNSWVPQVDIGASTTDVFKVLGGTDYVGQNGLIRFKINKPICL